MANRRSLWTRCLVWVVVLLSGCRLSSGTVPESPRDEGWLDRVELEFSATAVGEWELDGCMGHQRLWGPCSSPDPRPSAPPPEGVSRLYRDLSLCVVRGVGPEAAAGVHRRNVSFVVEANSAVHVRGERPAGGGENGFDRCAARAAEELSGSNLSPGVIEYGVTFGRLEEADGRSSTQP